MPGDQPSDPRARSDRLFLFVRRQPGWLVRLAAGAGLIVFVAVITLLVLPALLAAAAVFLVGAVLLAGYLWLVTRFGRRGRAIVRYEGRENVRVVDPDRP